MTVAGLGAGGGGLGQGGGGAGDPAAVMAAAAEAGGLGHAAGDAVLKAFAQRLRQSVRATDTIARLGGDEFVIILEGVNGPEEPQIVARKIVANVTRPLPVEGRTLALTTSIGIAFRRHVHAADAATSEALIARADAALYAAKKAGRNTWRVVAEDLLIEPERVQ